MSDLTFSAAKQITEEKPDLFNMSPEDLVRFNQAQERVKDGSFLERVGHQINQATNPIADLAGDVLSKPGELVGSEFISDVGESFGQLGGQSLPSVLAGLSTRLLSGRAKAIPLVLSSLAEFGRTKAETGDNTSALVSGASVPLSILGGVAGSQSFRRAALNRGASKSNQIAAELAGDVVGSIPGDLFEIGFSNPEKDPLENLHDFFIKNPAQGTAFGLFQVAPVAASRVTAGKLSKQESSITPEQNKLNLDRYFGQDPIKPYNPKVFSKDLTGFSNEQRDSLKQNLAEELGSDVPINFTEDKLYISEPFLKEKDELVKKFDLTSEHLADIDESVKSRIDKFTENQVQNPDSMMGKRLFSFDKYDNNLFSNNLLKAFDQVTLPRVKKGVKLNPRLNPDKEGNFKKETVVKTLRQFLPSDAFELVNFQLQKIKSDKLSAQNFKDLFKNSIPEVNIVPMLNITKPIDLEVIKEVIADKGPNDVISAMVSVAETVSLNEQLSERGFNFQLIDGQIKLKDKKDKDVKLNELSPFVDESILKNLEDAKAPNDIASTTVTRIIDTVNSNIRPFTPEFTEAEKNFHLDRKSRSLQFPNLNFFDPTFRDSLSIVLNVPKIDDSINTKPFFSTRFNKLHTGGIRNPIGFSRSSLIDEENARFVYEIQSDNLEFSAPAVEALQRNYQSLLLKAAIKRAKEEGLTSIITPDATTVSRIEDWVSLKKEDLERHLKGARSNYDVKIPSLLTKITGKKPVKFKQKFSEAEVTKNFKKDPTLTGFKVDITDVKPEEFTLFSLEESLEQSAFEQELLERHDVQNLNELDTVFEEIENSAQPRSINDFASLIRDMSENRDNRLKQIAANYLHRIRAVDENTTIQTFEGDSQLKGFARQGEDTFVNTNQSEGSAGAFVTAVHELAHQAQYDYKTNRPEQWESVVKTLNEELDFEQRASILKELSDLTGAPLNVDYLAGKKFNSLDQVERELLAMEFVSGISEAMAFTEFKKGSKRRGALEEFYELIPPSLRRVIGEIVRQVRAVFNVNKPSALHALDGKFSEPTKRAVDLMSEIVFKTDQADLSAHKQLRRFEDIYSVESMVKEFKDENPKGTLLSLDNVPKDMRKIANRIFSLENQMDAEIQTKGFKKTSWPLKFLAAGIGTAHTHPYTRNIFNAAHRFRGTLQSYLSGYRSLLSENAGSENLSEAQVLNEIDQYLVDLNQDETRLKDVSNAIWDDQKRRQSGQAIKTKEEAIAEFGLSEEDASFIQRLYRAVQQVGFDSVTRLREKHKLQLAQLLVARTKMDVDRAKALVTESTDSSNKWFDVAPTASTATDTEIALSTLLEKAGLKVRDEEGNFTPDFELFKAKAELMMKERHAQTEQIKKGGYAPMIRRHRYIAKGYNLDADRKPIIDDEEGGMTVVGFNKKKDLDAWVAENRDRFEKISLLDKKGLAEEYQFYAHEDLLNFYNTHAQKFESILANYKERVHLPPDQMNQVEQLFNDVINDFRHEYTQEFSDMLSVKGDKTLLRRSMVQGFNPLDFIPNALDYIDTKTIGSIKQVAKQEVALEMLRPEIQANDQLRQQLEGMVNYALNAGKHEFGAARKFVYDWYLALSLKQFIQNSFQNFQIAIPHMARTTGKFSDGYKYYKEALSLFKDFALKKKTGDSRLDTLLNDAIESGVLRPKQLDFFIQTNDMDIDPGGIRGGTFGKGLTQAGLQKRRATNIAQRVLNSPTVISDVANRKVAFIMRAKQMLDEIDAGNSDLTLDDILKSASNFSDDVNFVGDKVNRPGFLRNLDGSWLHGPALTATALMSHVINHFTLLGTYLYEGRMGTWNDTTNSRNSDGTKSWLEVPFNVNNPAMKSFYVNMAHMGLLAGMMGLPFYQDLDNILEEITGFSIDRAFKEGVFDLAEDLGADNYWATKTVDLAFAGLPGALGIDMTFSMGLGNVINYNVGQPTTLWGLFGASGDLMKRAIDASNTLANNPTEGIALKKFARQLAPQGINQFLRWYDVLADGTYKTRSGLPATIDPLSGTEIASLVMGYQPLKASKEASLRNDFRVQSRRNERSLRTRVDQAAAYFAEFQKTNNPSSLQDAQRVITKTLNDFPSTGRESLMDSVAKRALQYKNPSITAPSLRQQRALDQVSGGFPGARIPVRSNVSESVQEALGRALLGGDLSGVESLGRTIEDDLLRDLLIKSGLPPAVVSILVNPNDERVQTLGRSLMSRTPPTTPSVLQF